MDSEPLIFWRDGFDSGTSGHYVRAVSLNEVIPKWIEEGIKVAGIRIDAENGNNIDVLVVREDSPNA